MPSTPAPDRCPGPGRRPFSKGKSMLLAPLPHARNAPVLALDRFRGPESRPPRAVLHLSRKKSSLRPDALAPSTPHPRNSLHSAPKFASRGRTRPPESSRRVFVAGRRQGIGQTGGVAGGVGVHRELIPPERLQDGPGCVGGFALVVYCPRWRVWLGACAAAVGMCHGGRQGEHGGKSWEFSRGTYSSREITAMPMR
jgi:hypothetical protein